MCNKELEGLPCAEYPSNFICDLCGEEDNVDEYISSCELLPIMIERHVCFRCAFWIDKIEHPVVGREIINGHHFVVHPFVKRPENVLKGFGGHEFYIRRFDGTLIKSNNVWHQGEIPAHFRSQLPDTAVFLTLMDYQNLVNHPYKCTAKGCWDRYHCLRYDLSCESEGPFNKVPDNHKIGSERCPSFIHSTNLIL